MSARVVQFFLAPLLIVLIFNRCLWSDWGEFKESLQNWQKEKKESLQNWQKERKESLRNWQKERKESLRNWQKEKIKKPTGDK